MKSKEPNPISGQQSACMPVATEAIFDIPATYMVVLGFNIVAQHSKGKSKAEGPHLRPVHSSSESSADTLGYDIASRLVAVQATRASQCECKSTATTGRVKGIVVAFKD